jgi:DNA-binding XRE family transcriptional regulator
MNNNSINEKVGIKLSTLRKELKITQEELASVLQSHRFQIYKYESGKSKLPVYVAIQICRTYGVDLNYFMVHDAN